MRARQHCVGSPIQACTRLQALDMIAQHSRIYILFFFSLFTMRALHLDSDFLRDYVWRVSLRGSSPVERS